MPKDLLSGNADGRAAEYHLCIAYKLGTSKRHKRVPAAERGMIMRKHCGNCAVYDRKNMKHSELCGKCVTEHFSNGKESDPSMWKPLPQTNAGRFRAMSDEEQQKCVRRFWEIEDFADWLKQPAEDHETV